MNDDILFGIGIGVFGIIIATALICIVVPFFEKENLCVYCNSEITDTADVVCCSDGRKYHAECYMMAIREDVNSDMNALTNVENEEDDSIIREFIVHPDGVISGSWNERKKVILDASE